jgi:hypothetical protein
MKTVQIRYLGNKKPKIVDLPIGLSANSEQTGTVVCNPVGEFPADQARALLAVLGASKLYVLESEFQRSQKPPAASKPAAAKAKKAAKGKKVSAPAEPEPEGDPLAE